MLINAIAIHHDLGLLPSVFSYLTLIDENSFNVSSLFFRMLFRLLFSSSLEWDKMENIAKEILALAK
jgi:hypothetical protein